MGAQDGAVRELVGVTGRTYRSKDGMYDLHPADARALRADGGFAPSLGSPTRGGWLCECGFHPLFLSCSRCGRTQKKDVA
jgi:hypothetical protein